jgi:hypothetical protein
MNRQLLAPSQSVRRLITKWRAVNRFPGIADIALGAVLAAGFAALTLVCYFRLSPEVYHFSTWDYWFEGDPARVYTLMTDRTSQQHHSTSHHPLFSALTYPPVFVLRSMIGLSAQTSVGLAVAAVSASWAALMFATLRLITLPRLDAAVFALLAAACASSIYFFSVPETFGLSSLSILVAIALAAGAERFGVAPPWVYIAASAVTLSMTTTNWSAGLALLIVFLPWREAALRAAQGFVVVLALWALQHQIFPETDMFLNVFRSSEVDYLFNSEAGGILPKLRAFFFHSVIVPDTELVHGYRLSVQGAQLGEGGPLAAAGATVWAALLAVTIWGLLRRRRQGFGFGGKTLLVLGLAIAGQLAVTIVFGIESFLYSTQFSPLLVIFAAFASLTPARPMALGLAAMLVAIALPANLGRLWEDAGQAAAQYEHETNFGASLDAAVEPDILIVCGENALAGSGEAARERPPAEALDVGLCTFSLDGALEYRPGWRLWYEDWSLEAVETLDERGAEYFATHNSWGLEQREELFDAMDERYLQLHRSDEFAIYDLDSPPATSGESE